MLGNLYMVLCEGLSCLVLVLTRIKSSVSCPLGLNRFLTGGSVYCTATKWGKDPGNLGRKSDLYV